MTFIVMTVRRLPTILLLPGALIELLDALKKSRYTSIIKTMGALVTRRFVTEPNAIERVARMVP